MKNKIILLMLFFISGCSSTLKYEMDNFKFLSPESNGEFGHGNMGISYGNQNQAKLSEIFYPDVFSSANTHVTNVNGVSNTNTMNLNFDIGLLEKLDLILLGDGTAGLKYQFYGDTRKSKTEGYKLSAAISYLKETKSSQGMDFSFNGQQKNYATSLDLASYKTSIIFGKRFNERFLAYLNFMADRYDYNGYLTSSVYGSVYPNGKSYNTGLLLGGEYQSGSNIVEKFELGVVRGKINSFDERISGAFAAYVGFWW
jgi:hypothetical protein